MQQRLSLFPAAIELAWTAVLFELRDVPGDGPPTTDLPVVIGATSPHEWAPAKNSGSPAA
jgi:hypothetical protein